MSEEVESFTEVDNLKSRWVNGKSREKIWGVS